MIGIILEENVYNYGRPLRVLATFEAKILLDILACKANKPSF